MHNMLKKSVYIDAAGEYRIQNTELIYEFNITSMVPDNTMH